MDGLTLEKSRLYKDKFDAAVHCLIARVEPPSDLDAAPLINIVSFEHAARSISGAAHKSVWTQTPDGSVMSATRRKAENLRQAATGSPRIMALSDIYCLI